MGLKKNFKLLIFVVFVLFILIVFLHIFQNRQDLYYKNIFTKYRDIERLQDIIDNTSAEGVLVYDSSQDKILGGKNISKVYSLASLTKIVTSFLIYEKDKTLLSDIRNMLKRSSNEEADRLAFVFSNTPSGQAEYMNDFTKKNGLHFRNVTGLDTDDLLPGGEGRPLDLIRFIREYYFKYPELFDETIQEKDNTNTAIRNLNFLTASKTGFTNISGGNLFVIVQKGLGRDIFILVLNSTEKNRFVDVQNIANFLLQSSI
jgi:D-alanyl-D-alanine carboxypeptidase